MADVKWNKMQTLYYTAKRLYYGKIKDFLVISAVRLITHLNKEHTRLRPF